MKVTSNCGEYEDSVDADAFAIRTFTEVWHAWHPFGGTPLDNLIETLRSLHDR